MAEKRYYLTEADRRRLKGNIDAVNKMPADGGGIYSGEFPETSIPSPETYIAKIKDEDEWIDPISDDVPGSAICKFYRQVRVGETGDTELKVVQIGDVVMERRVYNVSARGIPYCLYFKVTRSKAGFWQAEAVPVIPYGLRDCKRTRGNLVVLNDLSAHVGDVARFDGTCWEIVCLPETDPETATGYVTIEDFMGDCDACRNCWKLTKCGDDDPPVIIYTRKNLSSVENKIVRNKADGYCYTVTRSPTCETVSEFDYTDYYDTCAGCVEYCWTLVNCLDSEDIIYALDDLRKLTREETEELVISLNYTFLHDSKCYQATAFNNTEVCTDAESYSITKYYQGCKSCIESGDGGGCVKLSECEPWEDEEAQDIIFAKSVTIDGEQVDSGVLLNGDLEADPPVDPQTVVRHSNGKCYTISAATLEDCSTAETSVALLESYESCEECAKCYLLTKCDDEETTKVTYSDLAGLGFSTGQIIKEDDDSCWTITNDTEVWDETAVAFTVKEDTEAFSTCAECGGTQKYLLQNQCHNAECGNDPEAMPDIVTDEDLHKFDGKHVKHKGICYKVSKTSSTTELTGQGSFDTENLPDFDDCETCKNAVVTWTEEIVQRIFVESNALKYETKKVILSGKGGCKGSVKTADTGSPCVAEPNAGAPAIQFFPQGDDAASPPGTISGGAITSG